MIIFGVIFFVVGSGIFIYFGRNLQIALNSIQWPYTTGTILKAELKKVTYKGSSQNRGGHTSTQTDYQYSYKIQGTEYTSSRVTMSDKVVKTTGSLSKILKSIKEGQNVKVYYNPKDPSFSVLQRGPDIYAFTILITPSLMMSLGIALLFFRDELLVFLK